MTRLKLCNGDRTIIDELTAFARGDIENFRNHASQAFAEFNRSEQKLLRKIESPEISSYELLTKWSESLMPKLNSLDKARTNKQFNATIAKFLDLSDDEVKNKIDSIIHSRKNELFTQFLYSLFPEDKSTDKKITAYRNHASMIMSLPENEIEKLRNHLVHYLAYNEVAGELGIPVLNPTARIHKRLRMKSIINKERKRRIKQNKIRIAEIDRRLKQLENENNGLISDIYKQGWDLVEVVSIRNRYEKKLAEQSKDGKLSAVERLSIFDSETRAFRNEKTEAIVSQNSSRSLSTARKASKEIDALLLRIFDIDVICKNKLMTKFKEHRMLLQEKKKIIDKPFNL